MLIYSKLNSRDYTVSEGDTLVKVINEKYSMPGDILYNEYLDQLRKLNPDIKDLDHILPGQKVRLPIYSPKIVRGTIEEKPQKTKQDTNVLRSEAKEIGDHLNKIFTQIGEEWVQQGTHFIPFCLGQLKTSFVENCYQLDQTCQPLCAQPALHCRGNYARRPLCPLFLRACVVFRCHASNID